MSAKPKTQIKSSIPVVAQSRRPADNHRRRVSTDRSDATTSKASNSLKAKDAVYDELDLEFPTADELAEPGAPKRITDDSKYDIENAQRSHRRKIYIEIARWAWIARILLEKGEAGRRWLKGDLAERWRKTEKEPSELFRLLLQRVFPSQKEASKAYLGTRRFFEENVPAEEFPARIKAGGGYQKLAAINTKKGDSEQKGAPKSKVPRRLPITIQIGEPRLNAGRIPIPSHVIVGIEITGRTTKKLRGKVAFQQLQD